MADQLQQQPKKAESILSKKRYELIKLAAHNYFGEDAATPFLLEFQRIMNFDPTVKKYTPELGQKIIAARKLKASELGVSTYVISGAKARYHNKQRQAIQVNDVNP
jgi:hypothetical protein